LIGLAAGLLVGGSIFVTLMMLPQMVGTVSAAGAASAREEVKVETPAEVDALLKNDPQLAKILKQAQDAADKFHLPFTIRGTEVYVSWPREFSFSAVTDTGQVAWQLFALYAVLFLVVWALKNLAHFINTYNTRWVGVRVVADLRNQLFSKLTAQSLKYYGNMDSGQLISRITNDVQALEYSVSHSVEDLTNAPLQVLGCLMAIVVACREHNNFQLLIILGVFFPLLLLPLGLLGRKIRKIYRKSYKHIASVTVRMRETFFGIRAVKAYHTEDEECLRFRQANRQY
jgi:subfamily B ATP-binding cassette protein MsbA